MTLEELSEQISHTRATLFLMVAQAPDEVLRTLTVKKGVSHYLRTLAIRALLARIQCKRIILMGE